MSKVEQYRGELWNLREEEQKINSCLQLAEERMQQGFPGDNRSMYEIYDEHERTTHALERQRDEIRQRIAEGEKKLVAEEERELQFFNQRQKQLAEIGTQEAWQQRDKEWEERAALLQHREKQDDFRAWEARSAGETVLKQGREELEKDLQRDHSHSY